MDNNSTDHMVAKVLYHGKQDDTTLNSAFNNLIEVDKSLVCDNLIFYYRIIHENDVTVAFRSIFNHRLENLSKDEIVTLFSDYGCSNILKSLCEILKGFHSINVMCGAISLSNIILKSDSENEKYFYLCDYGMRISNESNVNYLAPEELCGKEIGLEVDIWCVGILLYYILSGNYPYESENDKETKRKIETMELPLLELQFGEIMNGLLSKMLQKNASYRISIFELDKYIDSMNNMMFLKVKTDDNFNLNNVVIQQQQQQQEQRQEEKEEVKKEESKEESKEEMKDKNNISLSWIVSSISQYAQNKVSEIKSKSQDIIHNSTLHYQSEMARRQAQLQADMARRQAAMARMTTEMNRKQAEIQAKIQSKLANVSPFIPYYKHN